MSLTTERIIELSHVIFAPMGWAKAEISDLESKGTPLTVEDCEWSLKQHGCKNKAMRKLIEGKARRAFRESVRNDKAIESAADEISKRGTGAAGTLCFSGYATLRRALYLATDEKIRERIQREIQTRFPWGSWK